MKARKLPIAAIVVCASFATILSFLLFTPSGPKKAPASSYASLRDDALAARYRPSIDCPAEFGPVIAVYYRAAKDEAGLVHIAYHPLWARERNSAPGFSPFLSRSLYTGGLSLQRLMFGKGDIESIALTVDPSSGEILRVEYETAQDYSPENFSVTHKNVFVEGPLAAPPRFSVVSWNHLFSLEKSEASQGPKADGAEARPPLSYFTAALWREYSMVKERETRLRKDRAHFDWEEIAAE
jgi:hypothetical protein